MDPTVTAACIGGGAAFLSGGWTARVAITTTRIARRTNEATIRGAAENTAHALDAAREDRIWDKRAEVYVDALYAARHRQERRKDATRTYKFDQATEDRRREWLASFNLPNEVGMEMRLLAYAKEPVLSAARAAAEANANVEEEYRHWVWLAGKAKSDGPDGPSGADLMAAQHAIRTALDRADSADEALLDAIRADLHSRPSQAVVLLPTESTVEQRPPEG